MLVGGGTSIFPRVAPSSSSSSCPTLASTSRSPRPSSGSSTAPTPARQPRPRPHQGPHRPDRHRRASARWSTRSCKGDWVDERDFDPDGPALRRRRGGRSPRAALARTARRTATSRVRALPRGQRAAAAPGRLLAPSTSRSPAATSRPSSCAGSRPIMREYSGGFARTTCTRTSSCAGSATRRSTRSGSTWTSSGSPTPAPTRSPTSSAAPARTAASSASRVDGPQRGDPGAGRGDAARRPADQADPHQDVRLPERLQPAPPRLHRLLRRLLEGQRAGRCLRMSPHSAATTRAASSSTAPAEGPACPRSGCRMPSSAGSRFYESDRNDGETFNDFAERVGSDALRGRRSRDLDAARRVQPRDDERVHRRRSRSTTHVDDRRGGSADYRYFDLRRPAPAPAIRLRSRGQPGRPRGAGRDDFVEIETPTLTRSTPEGAGDFLVPARLPPGPGTRCRSRRSCSSSC